MLSALAGAGEALRGPTLHDRGSARRDVGFSEHSVIAQCGAPAWLEMFRWDNGTHAKDIHDDIDKEERVCSVQV
jgi:hypothetical protein